MKKSWKLNSINSWRGIKQMKLKKNIFLIMIIALIFSCNKSGKKHENHSDEKVYTCPMHPEIIRNEPGQCPICGMDLVEKITGGESTDDKKLRMLLEPANKFVVSNISTVKLRERELPVTTTIKGYITYDTRQSNTVAARVSGRIEKLYVKYKYQAVSKGQKLMDIYSAELATEQENLLFLLKNDSENTTLIQASEKKLLLLGLTREQINQIKSSGQLFTTVTIYSPYTGHLHDITSSNGNTMGNNGMNASVPETQNLQVKEGMYIAKGQAVFNIYDTQKLWAVLNIYPDIIGSVNKGQKVKLEIDGLADKEINATVDFIEPTIREDQKSSTARVYLNNSNNEIKIGAIVTAKLIDKKQAGLFLPSSSIVSLGLNYVAFVKNDGGFKAKKVKIGNRSDQWTEIISGITKEDVIASNAQMLIDSESFIKVQEP
jgi:Cu(I)/Ag(I) efflux system membrane fusion protein